MKVNFHIKQMCWSLILEQQTQSTGRPGKSGEKVEQTFPQNPGQCFTPLPSAVFSCFFFFPSQCQWCSMIRSLFELSRSPHTNYFLLIGVFKRTGVGRMKTENFRTEGKKPKFDLRQRRSVSLQATQDPTFNCIQCVMFFQCAVSSRNK